MLATRSASSAYGTGPRKRGGSAKNSKTSSARTFRSTAPRSSSARSSRRQILKSASPGSGRSEEHASELQSLMRISYAVFCLKKKTTYTKQIIKQHKIQKHHSN